MPAPINLADPEFEPSDDDLKGLMERAFAGVRDASERNLIQMRARIAKLQGEAAARFEAQRASSRQA